MFPPVSYTHLILAGAPTEVSKNLTPYTDENPSDGSIIMFDRGRHASYPDYNNIKEIAADYSFIIGCDYIGQPAQGNSPSHRASAGYETSFKLYEGATVYVFTSTGNSDKAAENSWTYLAVSYTHLDVYKRQAMHRTAALRQEEI